MKSKLFLWIIVILQFAGGCRPDKKVVNGFGTLTFKVDHVKDGMPFILQGAPTYKNAAGNVYGFNMFKYYLSNIILLKADGGTVPLKNYQLIDLSAPETQQFKFEGVANGDYKGIRFLLGVDSIANATGDHTGALDPANGMDWGWNFGYRFFMLEGKYKKNDTAPLTTFTYHIGRNENLISIQLDREFTINDDQRSIALAFDLEGMFSNPNTWDISKVDYNHSETTANLWEIQSLIQNISKSFSISSVK